jgi:hypothetical protein
MNFLPLQFPIKQDILIPSHDKNCEQRASYPYTYTSTILMDEHEKQQVPYSKLAFSKTHSAKGQGQGQGQGQGHIRVPKTTFYTESEIPSQEDVVTKYNQSQPQSQPQVFEKRTHVYTLGGILVQYLDPLATMYSKEWLQDAEQEFRFQLMSFLSDNDVSSVLGKTRCRDCLYYFEKSVVKPSKSRIASLATFLSFWLDSKIIIGETPYVWKTIPKTTDKVIHMDHLDNGQWIVKNDKI